MPIPLGGDFKVAVVKPIDDRLIVETYNDLNNILNKYIGLICYVNDEKNIYVFQGSNNWEKIVTTNVDTVTVFNSNFEITQNHNGKVLYVDSPNQVTATLNGVFENGFNVAIAQMGDGIVLFNGGTVGNLRNKINGNKTAGKYSVASILKVINTNDFLLYGDLIN
jgi:hypothetical protein